MIVPNCSLVVSERSLVQVFTFLDIALTEAYIAETMEDSTSAGFPSGATQ